MDNGSVEPEPGRSVTTWRVRANSSAPFWRRLSRRLLAQAEVSAPEGQNFIVRVERNSPLDLSDANGVASSNDPLGVLLSVIATQAQTRGRTGWTIRVIRPATEWRAERKLFAQKVMADAIVADIAMSIVDAIERGDRLWRD